MMSYNIENNSFRINVRSVSIVFVTVLVLALLAILTRPENSMAAFWPANAVLLGMDFPRFSGEVLSLIYGLSSRTGSVIYTRVQNVCAQDYRSRQCIRQ